MENIIKSISRIIENNWVFKIAVFWILSLFPSKLLFYLQQNITLRSVKPILVIDSDWDYAFDKINNCKKKNIRLIEFGAGRNLAQNIFLSLKFENLHQTVVDINRMVNSRLFFQAYNEISLLLGKEVDLEIKNMDELLVKLRISYESPIDIANYKPETLFDICLSKDTIEHIPTKKIDLILKNISKILHKEGLLISCVDYSDHYSHTSMNLSKINFLKYNRFIWSFLNPPNHYQNRIRHSDYIKLLNKNNFITDEEKLIVHESLDIIPTKVYLNYNKSDLLILRSKILSINTTN